MRVLRPYDLTNSARVPKIGLRVSIKKSYRPHGEYRNSGQERDGSLAAREGCPPSRLLHSPMCWPLAPITGQRIHNPIELVMRSRGVQFRLARYLREKGEKKHLVLQSPLPTLFFFLTIVILILEENKTHWLNQMGQWCGVPPCALRHYRFIRLGSFSWMQFACSTVDVVEGGRGCRADR